MGLFYTRNVDSAQVFAQAAADSLRVHVTDGGGVETFLTPADFAVQFTLITPQPGATPTATQVTNAVTEQASIPDGN